MANAAVVDAKNGQVITPEGRLLYPNLLKPRGMKGDETSKPKFSATLLIPADADITELKKLAAAVAQEKFGKDWKNKKLRTPFLNTADYEKLADFAEEFPVFIRTSANEEFPPYIAGPDLAKFEGDGSEIYGGRWAKLAVRAFGYDNKGNRGISFGLQRVRLGKDDEPIGGGRVETADGFDAINVAGKPKDTDAVWDEDKPKSAGKKSAAKGASAADPADLNDEIGF